MKPLRKSKRIGALCIRTAMAGGGTAYDVYFRVKDKPSRPLHCGHYYATVICRDGGEFYRVVDAIDPRDHWSMECGMDKWDRFKRLERVAKRLELRLLQRAFPELLGLRKLPALWAPWSSPSQEIELRVAMQLPD